MEENINLSDVVANARNSAHTDDTNDAALCRNDSPTTHVSTPTSSNLDGGNSANTNAREDTVASTTPATQSPVSAPADAVTGHSNGEPMSRYSAPPNTETTTNDTAAPESSGATGQTSPDSNDEDRVPYEGKTHASSCRPASSRETAPSVRHPGGTDTPRREKSVRFSPHGTVDNIPVRGLLSRALRSSMTGTAPSMASASEPATPPIRHTRPRRRTVVPERFRDRTQFPTRHPRGNAHAKEPRTDQPRSISPKEFPIDRIVSCHVNTDPEHPAAALHEPVYRVRWVGFDHSHDTYEPVKHLPRNKIVSFHRSNGTALPHNLNEAAAG